MNSTYYVRLEIGPLVNVPLPSPARFRHIGNLVVIYDSIPKIDTRHFANKALRRVETSSFRVLLLSQH